MLPYQDIYSEQREVQRGDERRRPSGTAAWPQRADSAPLARPAQGPWPQLGGPSTSQTNGAPQGSEQGAWNRGLQPSAPPSSASANQVQGMAERSMFPSYVARGATQQQADLRITLAAHGGYENPSQQQVHAASTVRTTLVQPSILRSAVNAPQFVPKSTPPPPSLASLSLGSGSGAMIGSTTSATGNLKSDAPVFEPGANLNRLAVQAPPFVPGTRGKPADGLNTTAAPFQPGAIRGGAADAHDGDRASLSKAALHSVSVGAEVGGAVETGTASGYYPSDEGYAEEDREEDAVPELYGDEIFDWSMGASSIPAPHRRTVARLGVPEQLRQYFLLKDLDQLRCLPADDERYKEIPPKYHLACALDDEKSRGIAGAFGYPNFLYKVVGQDDGNAYALRRFDNVRTTQKIVQSVVEAWRGVQHPNIIRLCKAFVQHGALFFVHEYHPLAQSVYQRYIYNRSSSGHRLPEKLLWSFIVQLLSAIRAVHASGAACRMIHPNYVLLTTGNRVRLGCMGVMDVLESETRKSLQELQKDDLFYMGRLIVMLATRAFLTPQNFNTSLASIGQTYSPEFHSLVVQLCTNPPSVFDLTNALTRHIMDEMDRQYVAVDDLEVHLGSEYENGRLLRLSLKLSQLLDNPTVEVDPAWGESGDRYILRLFRDYVYHQVDEEGNKVLDFGHIVHSLNKLDTGDPEKIVLMGRDQQTMIIVTFEDVKRCLETAWVELCSTANTSPHIPELVPPHGHHGQDDEGGRSPPTARRRNA